MKTLTSLAILLVVCSAMKISHKQVPGGWSTGPADQATDDFIRQQFPALAGANLVEAKKQVVAGFNY